MYKVYKIDPNQYCYSGVSFVAADNAEEANSFIANFKEEDEHNWDDSWGYSYVDENDVMDGLFAQGKGIVYHGIWYNGG